LFKQVNGAKGPDGLTEVRKAYEFTLDKLGTDINAGLVWQDYIAFLQVVLGTFARAASQQRLCGA
jgi:cleavage stimulation factor subunit 3